MGRYDSTTAIDRQAVAQDDSIATGTDEGAVRTLIREASLQIDGKGEVPRGFLAAVLGRGAPEDLLLYTAHELAALGEASFAHLKERTPGKPKIRVENPPPVAGAKRLEAVTVIEIINDDMPFLLDSVLGEIKEQGLSVRLVAHPILVVERDQKGKLVSWREDAAADKRGLRESVIQIHVECLDDQRRDEIVNAIACVLDDVRLCVSDWREMLSRLHAMIENLKTNPPPLPADEVAEAVAFLEWLAADNFAFLGCRDYAFKEETEGEMLEPVYETSRGILRNHGTRILQRGGKQLTVTPELREFMYQPVPLIITKANTRSRVHRRVHMDYIGVKRFDANGKLVGEFRMVGLFTSTAYTRAARSIPYLRRKIDKVLARAGFDPASHSGKALVNVLETYPRDELFQVDDDFLYRFSLEILQLDERPRVRVLARRDRFDRFVSILVFVPRDRYSSTTRARIGNYLAEAYKGRLSAFYPFFSESPLTRVHFIIGRDEGVTPNPDRATLEIAVEGIVREWGDGLAAALAATHDPVTARTLVRRYRDAFSLAYRENFSPKEAVADIRILETIASGYPTAIHFYRRGGGEVCANLKVLSSGRPIPLTERVPVLENMGFTVIDEHTYTVEPKDENAKRAWLHDMALGRAEGGAIDLEKLGDRLESCLMAVVLGQTENDGYNALVLAAGLPWREVALVRTMSRYLRQAGVPYSQDYLWNTLTHNAPIAAKIVALFQARFDPRIGGEAAERAAREEAIVAEIESALGAVESLDEDRILRRFVNLVMAAVRTNFYQVGADGHARPTISIKFESRKIDELPPPRPLYEIFVYSPRVEGVHLRFGKVARGGLRWSDRPQDFRTEVLGLVKAQQVKNAVIVPVGAKGGFVPKKLPIGAARQAILDEGTAAYELFVSTLLELTDNLDQKTVVPPPRVVRHDGDDPYLVVAADKGTATLSDFANGIALRNGFWLGDAFASGGSAGYDHKKMGITARGAWEAVKRHFCEMDVDIRSTPFTVAGVGDMSGDVFGNGMLLEKTIRLVAAFDHRDIFLDPAPEPERSWTERKRLFDLPRSSWQDYDKKLISKGGGVFARSAKRIELSSELRALLRFDAAEATPGRVMNAILKLPVDLLWFGGIGTYVRASSETDDRVGDRINDSIRIAATDLQCKVIGEGANLGMTQRGRIEAAHRGIRLNTDAIDNSAGVNSSDVEVNLKIALSVPVRDKRLSTEARNRLLAEMTDEVAALVLRNNYLQTLSLSLTERRGVENLGFQNRLMQSLEARSLLDRTVEFLPSDMEVAKRQQSGQALTRPELAILLAYAKIVLKNDLLASDVPDDPYLSQELARYFPKPVVERFPEAIEGHRLRREIIATMLANSMVNRGGPSFVARIADQTGADPAAIAKAFAAVRDSFGMRELNGEIDALDARMPGSLQLSLYAKVQDLLLDRVGWFLRNGDLKRGLAEVVSHYRTGIEKVESALDSAIPAERRAAYVVRAKQLFDSGVPETLARKIAVLSELSVAPDIVLVAGRTGKAVEEATAAYFALGALFQLDHIIEGARAIEVQDHFDQLVLDRALANIAASARSLTTEVLATDSSGVAAVEVWAGRRRRDVERARADLQEIAVSELTMSKLLVAAGLLGDLVER